MSYISPIDGSKPIKLSDIDPDDHGKLDRRDAEKRCEELGKELGELQELQYAAHETPILIVLQGMDTAGKDGTVRHAMASLNPQSCRVVSFKVPTPVEAAHDFLWRVHAETPARGDITIFNRSHYEDVLVTRVHNLRPEAIWSKRFDHINAFEKLLADNETIILKFFLHITKDEQKQRLQDREQTPLKAWKISAADWAERDYWQSYQTAYEDAINRCATPHAPWFVVPANHKWYRNAVILEAIVERLRPFKKQWAETLRNIGAAELKRVHELR